MEKRQHKLKNMDSWVVMVKRLILRVKSLASSLGNRGSEHQKKGKCFGCPLVATIICCVLFVILYGVLLSPSLSSIGVVRSIQLYVAKTVYIEYDFKDLWYKLLNDGGYRYDMWDKGNINIGFQECYYNLHDKHMIIDSMTNEEKLDFEANDETSDPRLIDVFYYFVEIDMFEARFNELFHSIDVFVVLECSHSWSGIAKTEMKFINDLKTKKPHIYEEYFVKNKKIFYYIMDWQQYYQVDYVRLSYEMKSANWADFLKSNEWHSFLNDKWGIKQLNNDDLIIVSDLDEIPRGLSVYFVKKCHNLLMYNGNKHNYEYYPISFDLMVFNYDFGCQYSLGINGEIKRETKWRAAKIVRFEQLNLNHKDCGGADWVSSNNNNNNNAVVSLNTFDENEKLFENYQNNKLHNVYNSDKKGYICPRWMLHLGYLDYYDLLCRLNKNGFNRNKECKQFTFKNDGWHLSYFFNDNKLVHLKLNMSGDAYKNTKKNHEKMERLRRQCAHLDGYEHGTRVYFPNDLEYIFENKKLSLKYPQWAVKKAIDNDSFWKPMFPSH